jgi:hypothetical protein
MGLFGFKSKGKTNGNYKLNTLTQGEKNAVLQMFDLAMQGPVQAGIKGVALENARCVGNYTYKQLKMSKEHVQSDSLTADDVKTVAFVLTSSSFAVGELIKKLQNEKIGGERLARASILQANGLSAKKKVDLLLQKQDNDWESF